MSHWLWATERTWTPASGQRREGVRAWPSMHSIGLFRTQAAGSWGWMKGGGQARRRGALSRSTRGGAAEAMWPCPQECLGRKCLEIGAPRWQTQP